MASLVVDWLVRSLAQERAYAVRLVDDLSDADMIAQPVPGVVMNHPAWILGHLSAYPPALAAMLRGQIAPDPIVHPFGRESKPESDLSVYGSKEKIVGDYLGAHDELAHVLSRVDPVILDNAVSITRWQGRFPSVGAACFYLMTTHVATHLGQLSAWRRVGGRAAV